MAEKVVRLPAADISRIACDAKLVAIRWDLIPCGLVLDIDAPISEAKKSPVRRVWLSFVGISEISWPLENSRLPDGCWFTSGAEITELPDGFTKFEIVTLAPQFDSSETMKPNPSRTLCICSKNLLAVMSEKKESPGSRGLSRSARLKLANDDEMLECVFKNLPVVCGW